MLPSERRRIGVGEGDDERAYLPRVLSLPVLSWVLSPPPGFRERRDLYSLRMTMALLSFILFGAQAALFAALGRDVVALAALGGMAGLALSMALLRHGHDHLALVLGWSAIFAYGFGLHFAYGAEVHVGWFVFPVSVAAYSVYRPEEWGWRLVPITLGLVMAALVVIPVERTPPLRLTEWEERLFLAVHVAASLYATFVLASHAAVFREAARLRIIAERNRADELLLNILPPAIAPRLIRGETTIADTFADVSVLFADLVGFTKLSGTMESARLVELLNEVFTEFDRCAQRHGLEKIKTIGDAYMVVAGLPEPVADHAARAVRMAIDMQRAVSGIARRTAHDLQLRVGLHAGPVTAGVIGDIKFAYDLWGDTVNVASRMESLGRPGRIHVSRAIVDRLQGEFAFTERRELEVKGKGAMETWFVDEGAGAAAASAGV